MDVYDKVYYDREYVQNVSLKFDLKVIWKSIQVVLGRKGVVDGKIDPEFRRESIVLLRESRLVSVDDTNCETKKNTNGVSERSNCFSCKRYYFYL